MPAKRANAGAEHAAPVEGELSGGSAGKLGDRYEAYRRLARSYAAEAGVMLPSALSGQARREHVRACIVEDHAERIDRHALGTHDKFRQLARSRFSFFRGTALLFYRDMAGFDPRMPTVMLLGDLHPENFGIMPNADNVPIFSVNDFDEVLYGPFTWDLRRGTTGFMVAAKTEGGHGRKKRRKIARRFLHGYIERMGECARSVGQAPSVLHLPDAPPIIEALFRKAMTERGEWLAERYLNRSGRGFRVSDELTPISSRRAEFQAHIDALAERNAIPKGGRFGRLKVKDVARRHGQGTASLGLDRFYVLLEGPAGDARDDITVEFKRARRSAMAGLVPDNEFDSGSSAERIAHGQRVHIAHGDRFFGVAEIDGESFMSRERAPYRKSIKLAGLSLEDWMAYAHVCGQALTVAHARSDDAGKVDYAIEPGILEAMEPHALFVSDILNFAAEAAGRVKRDHKGFRHDHAHGAFTRLPRYYR